MILPFMQQLYMIKLLLLRNEVMYNGERSLLSLHNKYVLFHESFLVDQIQFRNHQKAEMGLPGCENYREGGAESVSGGYAGVVMLGRPTWVWV